MDSIKPNKFNKNYCNMGKRRADYMLTKTDQKEGNSKKRTPLKKTGTCKKSSSSFYEIPETNLFFQIHA